MAFTFGFYNSLNGDRKYNAEQISAIFDGLITDGVYATVGKLFAVEPGTGLQVTVDSGKAWFNHTWNENDAKYPLNISAADLSLDRFDAIVIDINQATLSRVNQLMVVKGTPGTNPVKPAMANTTDHFQHPLAYVRVRANATSISKSDIEVVVGKSECPFVTGLIETVQLDALFTKWEGDFEAWFDNVKSQLEGNVVTNLQNQIDQRVKYSDKATAADITNGATDKWVAASDVKQAVQTSGYNVGDMRISANDLETQTNGEFILCDGRTIRASAYPKLSETLKGNFGGYSTTNRNLDATSEVLNLRCMAVNQSKTEVAFVFATLGNGISNFYVVRKTYPAMTTVSTSYKASYSGTSYTNYTNPMCCYNGDSDLIIAFPSAYTLYNSPSTSLYLYEQTSPSANLVFLGQKSVASNGSGWYSSSVDCRLLDMFAIDGAVYAIVYSYFALMSRESDTSCPVSGRVSSCKIANQDMTVVNNMAKGGTYTQATKAIIMNPPSSQQVPVRYCILGDVVYFIPYTYSSVYSGLHITSSNQDTNPPQSVISFLKDSATAQIDSGTSFFIMSNNYNDMQHSGSKVSRDRSYSVSTDGQYLNVIDATLGFSKMKLVYVGDMGNKSPYLFVLPQNDGSIFLLGIRMPTTTSYDIIPSIHGSPSKDTKRAFITVDTEQSTRYGGWYIARCNSDDSILVPYYYGSSTSAYSYLSRVYRLDKSMQSAPNLIISDFEIAYIKAK